MQPYNEIEPVRFHPNRRGRQCGFANQYGGLNRSAILSVETNRELDLGADDCERNVEQTASIQGFC